MNFKEFLKPTRGKMLVFGLILVLTFLFLWVFLDCFTVYGREYGSSSYGPPGSKMFLCALPQTVIAGIIFLLLWPFGIAMLVWQLSGIGTGMDYSLVGLLPRLIFFAIGILVNLLWLWVISCTIVKLIKKFRKK